MLGHYTMGPGLLTGDALLSIAPAARSIIADERPRVKLFGCQFLGLLHFSSQEMNWQGLYGRLETPEYNKKGIIYDIVLTQEKAFFFTDLSIYLDSSSGSILGDL